MLAAFAMGRRRAWPLRLRNRVANVQLVWSGNASQRATTASFDHEEGCKTTRKRVWCRVSLCVCSLSYVRTVVFLKPKWKAAANVDASCNRSQPFVSHQRCRIQLCLSDLRIREDRHWRDEAVELEDASPVYNHFAEQFIKIVHSIFRIFTVKFLFERVLVHVPLLLASVDAQKSPLERSGSLQCRVARHVVGHRNSTVLLVDAQRVELARGDSYLVLSEAWTMMSVKWLNRAPLMGRKWDCPKSVAYNPKVFQTKRYCTYWSSTEYSVHQNDQPPTRVGWRRRK